MSLAQFNGLVVLQFDDATTGNFQAQAPITVRLTALNTLAPIFSDEIGTPLANPFNSGQLGQFTFWVESGNYNLISNEGTPEEQQLLNVPIIAAIDGDFVDLTTDQLIGGIKTFSLNPISSAVQSAAINSLTRKDYVDALVGAIDTGLLSFNGRTDTNVIPTANDYTAAQVSYDPALLPNPLYSGTETQGAIDKNVEAILFLAGAVALRGTWDATLNEPNLLDNVLYPKIHGNYWIVDEPGTTALPNYPDGLAPISDWLNLDRVLYLDDSGGTGFERLRPDTAAYLLLTGGTMSGQIKGIAPIDAPDLTRKDYVDGNFLPLTGGTLTNVNAILKIQNTDDLNSGYINFQNQTGATTGFVGKGEVDAGMDFYSIVSDLRLTAPNGVINLNAPTTSVAGVLSMLFDTSTVSKPVQFVSPTITGGIRLNGTDLEFINYTTGGTAASVNLLLPYAPTAASQLTRKDYVDNAVASIPPPVYPVTSVFARTGAVVAVATDYTPAFIGAATAAQGAKADTATQPGAPVSSLANDAGYITAASVPSFLPTYEYNYSSGSFISASAATNAPYPIGTVGTTTHSTGTGCTVNMFDFAFTVAGIADITLTPNFYAGGSGTGSAKLMRNSDSENMVSIVYTTGVNPIQLKVTTQVAIGDTFSLINLGVAWSLIGYTMNVKIY